MEINEFKNKLQGFIDLIEKYTMLLMSDKQVEIKEFQTQLIMGMQDTIPVLIQMCMEEDPTDQYGNVAYWTSQLNKCITCLEGEDAFAIADAFYHEMRPNLVSLVNSI